MPKAGAKASVQWWVFYSRGEACVRLQGPCLVPALKQCSTAFPSPVCTPMLGERQLCIMHYALCIGKIMFDRFSIPCLHQHVRRTPIMHYALCIGKIMFDRFSIPCLHPHVGRTPIMHYALCIMHWKGNVRPLSHPLFAPACWANANYALCIMHYALER